MRKNVWIPVIAIGLLILVTLNYEGVTSFLGQFNSPHDKPPLEEFTLKQLEEFGRMYAVYIKGRTIITLITTPLLLYLLVTYIRIYRDTSSNFSLYLVLLSSVLLLYVIMSNPILIWLSGFRQPIGQVFNFLPDVFTSIASIILIYLSKQ